MTKSNQNHKSVWEDLSVKIPEWMGSTTSIIVHTILFIGIFGLKFFGFGIDQIMLILTTAVSLEAIYLSLFIQMTVNRHTESLEDVEEDIEGIEGDIDDIQEDVEEIQKKDEESEDTVDELESNVNKLKIVEQDLSKLLEDIKQLRGEMKEK